MMLSANTGAVDHRKTNCTVSPILNGFGDPRNHAATIGKHLRVIIESSRFRQCAAGLGLSLPPLEWLVEELFDLKFRLALIGKGSTGKSTVLNAILGEDIFPAKRTPSTAALQEVGFGPRIGLNPILHCGTEEQLGDISSAADAHDWLLSHATTGDEDAINGGTSNRRFPFKGIRISHPCDLLASGLTLVDTPGFGSIIGTHDVILQDAISAGRIDGVLYIRDIYPIGEDEKIFYNAHLKGKFQILVALNKVDELDFDPRDIKDLMEYNAKEMEVSVDSIIPISCRNNLKIECSGDGSFSQKAELSQFRKDIETAFAGNGARHAKYKVTIQRLQKQITQMEQAVVVANPRLPLPCIGLKRQVERLDAEMTDLNSRLSREKKKLEKSIDRKLENTKRHLKVLEKKTAAELLSSRKTKFIHEEFDYFHEKATKRLRKLQKDLDGMVQRFSKAEYCRGKPETGPSTGAGRLSLPLLRIYRYNPISAALINVLSLGTHQLTVKLMAEGLVEETCKKISDADSKETYSLSTIKKNTMISLNDIIRKVREKQRRKIGRTRTRLNSMTKSFEAETTDSRDYLMSKFAKMLKTLKWVQAWLSSEARGGQFLNKTAGTIMDHNNNDRNHYPEFIKTEIAQLVNRNEISIAEAARRTGASKSSIYRWRKEESGSGLHS